MTEGRRMRGSGMDNLEDYVEERLTYSSDSDEYAAANRTLEQEQADLNQLRAERGQPNARPDIDRLIEEAQLRVDRMSLVPPADQIQSGSGSQADLTQTPPTAEARSRVAGDQGQG